MNRLPVALALALLTSACATTTPAPAPAVAPKAKSAEAQALYDQVSRLDTEMFNAYNAHDAATMRGYFAEDLEFYHDTGGLLTLDVAMNGLKSVFAQSPDIRRDLILGSMEVYPIRGYGAIEVASHRFCHKEDGADVCGTFKFTHVWRNKDGKWQVTRAVSYDH